MFTTKVITEPAKFLEFLIQKHLKNKCTNGLTERQEFLLSCLKKLDLKWEIEDCGGGECIIGINWKGHSSPKKYGLLNISDIKFCLQMLTFGCGIDKKQWNEKYENEITFTTIYSIGHEDDGNLFASFRVRY